MKISCIIMASGLSKRMGENKLLLDFNGKKLYQHTFDVIDQIDFDEVILASSYDEILEDGKSRGYKSILNENNEEGKASSIRIGVENADQDSALMFFVADQPLLKLETVEELIKAYKDNEVITYPVVNRRRGAPVIFPSSFRDGLMSLKGDAGGMLLVKDNPVNEVKIDDESELMDIDTYESFEALKENHGK